MIRGWNWIVGKKLTPGIERGRWFPELYYGSGGPGKRGFYDALYEIFGVTRGVDDALGVFAG
jgi:hypothetical protein